MRTKKLGNSNLELTVIGFGAWAIGGGDYEFGWGPQDDRQAADAIHKALDLGVNWIDTAPVYGLGRSEETVGKALAGRKGKVIVATKCGLKWDSSRKVYRDLTAESVKKECEDSLRRLKIDAIDLYQIHWPDPDAQIEEGWGAVNDLKAEGKIRFGGVSNFSVRQMERASKIGPVTSLQPPYHLFSRQIEAEILPYCGRNNIGVVAYSPLASGLLTGKFTPERILELPAEDWRRKYNQNFREPKLQKNLDFVAAISRLARDYDHSISHLAVAWVLRRAEVTSAIVGARNPKQVEETAGAGDWILPQVLVEQIENIWARYYG